MVKPINFRNLEISGKKNQIQGIRGFAILSVLLYHLFPSIFRYGFLGVDMFFVLSGFLITKILISEFRETQRVDVKLFVINRFSRIFPNLVVTIFFFYIVAYFVYSPNTLIALSQSALSTIFGVSNLWFSQKIYYFDNNAALQPFLNFWSLGVEISFYIFWGIILIMALHLKSNMRVMIRNLIILSLIFINLPSLFTVQEEFYLLPFRFLEFGFGAYLTSLKHGKIVKEFFKNTVMLSNLATLLLVVLITLDLKELDSIRPFLVTLLTGFLIIISGQNKSGLFYFKVLDNSFMHHIGNLSYSLYLIHWPLLYTFNIISPSKILSNSQTGEMFTLVDKFMVVLLSYLGSLLIHLLIEKRAFRKKVKFWLIAVFFIALLNLFAILGNGFPNRFDSNLISEINPSYGLSTHDYYYGDCWLTNKSDVNFSKSCHLESNTAIIWGDSDSAGIAYELKALFKKRGGLTTYSKDGCYPEFYTKNSPPRNDDCGLFNSEVSKLVIGGNFSTAILHAHWPIYMEPDVNVLSELSSTVKGLRSLNLKVYIIGSSPTWSRQLPDILIERSDKFGMSSIYRPISDVGLEKGFSWDSALKKTFTGNSYTDVFYFSVMDLFCDKSLCTPFIPEIKNQILTYDQFHLTPKAASYVAKLFMEDLYLEYNQV